MTIAVAFDGIAAAWDDIHLTHEELKDFALDQLADAAGTADEELTFLLADADLTNYLAFPGPLAKLARRSGVSREIALRKWRYAAFQNWVDPLAIPNPTSDQWQEFAEWLLCDWYRFHLDWTQIITDPPLPSESTTWKRSELAAFLDNCRDWLERERAQILAS